MEISLFCCGQFAMLVSMVFAKEVEVIEQRVKALNRDDEYDLTRRYNLHNKIIGTVKIALFFFILGNICCLPIIVMNNDCFLFYIAGVAFCAMWHSYRQPSITKAGEAIMTEDASSATGS